MLKVRIIWDGCESNMYRRSRNVKSYNITICTVSYSGIFYVSRMNDHTEKNYNNENPTHKIAQDFRISHKSTQYND